MICVIYSGEDYLDGIYVLRMYVDYDGIIFGYEMKLLFIVEDLSEWLVIENLVIDFVFFV